MYILTITKKEKNDNYKEELAAWEEHNKYGYRMRETEVYPTPEKITRSLEVELTDEEYRKMKEEVIKVFN